MKKLMIAGILLLATSGVLFAQNSKPGKTTPINNKNNPGYVDANKNSLCDNYENRGEATDGKGQAQMRGKSCGYGKGKGQCNSTMQGRGNGNRRKGC